jgi:hypothetical protein
METRAHPPGLQDVLEFPLVEAALSFREHYLAEAHFPEKGSSRQLGE